MAERGGTAVGAGGEVVEDLWGMGRVQGTATGNQRDRAACHPLQADPAGGCCR